MLDKSYNRLDQWRHKYSRYMAFLFVSMIVVFSLSVSGLSIERNVNGTRGTYWRGICEDLDFFIIEPCENLVTPDGYGSTPEGQRVAACIAGGGLLSFLDPSLQSLLAAQPLGKAVGCKTLLSENVGGGSLGGGGSDGSGSGLSGLLDRLLN